MATQFRDTQFGHLIRSVSGNKLFRYPDEIDPSLWKKSHQRDKSSTCARSEEQTNASSKDFDARDTDLEDVSVNDAVEDGNDIYLIDWYGPDDPENPQNWSSSWKFLVGFQICLLNFSFYIASSIYVPGALSIMEDFGVSEIVATLGLSLFTIGYGFGPMLWSPMSEMPKLGRSGIYFWTLFVFVLLQLPTGFAINMPMFLVFRLLSGFFGSPCLATGGATMADIYDPARFAYGICILASFGVCGPVFGPILGGFVAPAKGWRWTIWVFTWLCAFVVVVLFFFLPETSAANILYKRAKRLRNANRDDRLRSQPEIDAAHHTMRDHLIVLGRAFTLTFSEPIVFFMDLYTALLYGVLFTWFESFPLVFGEVYGFDLSQQGLVFLGIFAGGVITVPLFLVWVKYGIILRFTKPTFKPEMVLPPTFFGSASLPICLFWYGWSARKSIHWIMPIIGSSFFIVGIITLFNPVLNYLGIAYPPYAASIFAGNALFRASFGATFPLFVSCRY
ncbi:MFS general substrate transporter [Lepidopterella palustris CBS 459.81]|uniref:MFS general substrate transporter n=1 Tax=Lepidopterella palustris CBS 459.81 TaxID=1314670 RepID=A0A8E2J9Y7_9PEZI|nr:MFS general substrate transporter [Lepidopterella palustris CBS 459.81]